MLGISRKRYGLDALELKVFDAIVREIGYDHENLHPYVST